MSCCLFACLVVVGAHLHAHHVDKVLEHVEHVEVLGDKDVDPPMGDG